uniref:Chromo domain-containing protein n=1 Tax=Globodera rostochiensis TaxID=31243 RepID=A0A914H6K2_GLORO
MFQMLCKRAPTAIQKKQQHQQQTPEPQYELKAVHAYFRNKTGQEAYFVSWLAYRNKEWVLSEDCEAVEMTNKFSREAGTHSTLKALCGKPVSTDQKNLIEADPYFQKLKDKFGAQLPAIESNNSDILWAPNTQSELKREAIETLPEFIGRCMSA